MQTYEIEIKTLLGRKENANALIERMRSMDVNFMELGLHQQLNHYFMGGDTTILRRIVVRYLPADKIKFFNNICDKARDFSLRTRQADKEVLLVIKASVDDTTSSNGIARIEFESKVKGLTLEKLDDLMLKSGFDYQAKWSRERREFKYKGLNVTIDKNAGYGFLAEFEKQIDDPTRADVTKSFIRDRMTELGIEELQQDRLERMFAYYNQNWQQYYGTDKTFIID